MAAGWASGIGSIMAATAASNLVQLDRIKHMDPGPQQAPDSRAAFAVETCFFCGGKLDNPVKGCPHCGGHRTKEVLGEH